MVLEMMENKSSADLGLMLFDEVKSTPLIV